MTNFTWESDSQQKSLEVSCVNQFLALHGATVVNQGTPSVTFTGNISNGSNTITSVSSIANLFVGMPLSGTGINSYTTIVAISTGVVTMSTYASATITGNSVFAFFNQTNGGVFNNWQSVGGYMIDQPFIQSGTSLGWIRVPIINQDFPAPSVTFTGDISNGSNTIINVSSIANLFVGMPLSGTGIDSDTTIVDISNGVVTMSTYASADITGNSVLAVADATAYDHAVNVTLGVYKDNAGVPGTLISQQIISSQVIEAVNNSVWPEPQDVLSGVLTSQPLASFPLQSFPSTYNGFTSFSAGKYMLLIIGPATGSLAPGATLSAPIFSNYYDGKDIQGWKNTGQTPQIHYYSIYSYCPTAQVIVAQVDNSNTYFAATFSQDGVLGAWQALTPPVISTAISFSSMGVLTNNGVDYLFVIGGTDSNNAYAFVYYTAINSNATAAGWSTGNPFPHNTMTYDFNGVITGLNCATSSPCFNMADGGLVMQDSSYYGLSQYPSSNNLYKLSSPTGTWEYIGHYNDPSDPAFALTNFIHNGMFSNGSYLHLGKSTTSFTSSGISNWSMPVNSRLPATATGAYGFAGTTTLWNSGPTGAFNGAFTAVSTPVLINPSTNTVSTLGSSSLFDNGDGSSTAYWCAYNSTSYRQQIYPCKWVNVPLAITGLTNGSTYHIVLSGSTPNNFSNANVPLMTSPGTSAQISSDGGNTWTSLGYKVPHIIFNSNDTKLLGLIEDNGARVTSMWIDQVSSNLLDVTQATIFTFPATLTGYTFTGNTTSQSNTITGISSTTGIVAGMVVNGTGIPVNTLVVSTTPTTITMSNNAQLSTNGLTFTAGSTTIGITGPLDISPGMPVSGMGIPNNTSIVTVNNSSLVLNNAATMSCTTLLASTTASVEAEVLSYTDGVLSSITGIIS